MGDTILQAAENLPLKNDGTVTFSVVVPENTATFSIKVSDSYGNKISIFQESCFSLINVSHEAAQFGNSSGRLRLELIALVLTQAVVSYWHDYVSKQATDRPTDQLTNQPPNVPTNQPICYLFGRYRRNMKMWSAWRTWNVSGLPATSSSGSLWRPRMVSWYVVTLGFITLQQRNTQIPLQHHWIATLVLSSQSRFNKFVWANAVTCHCCFWQVQFKVIFYQVKA